MVYDLNHTPARKPPPGRSSDFDNPESRSYQLVIVIAICMALAVSLTLLRTYVRLKISHSFGADDWISIVATIFTVAYSGLILHLLDKPGGGILGIHLWDVPISKLLSYQKDSLADSIIIRITNTLIKVGFLVFYLRIFNIISRIRAMVWLGMFALIGFCIAFVIVDLVACVPRSDEPGKWVDPKLMRRCNSITPGLITAGAWFNVFTDFYILLIPLHMIPELGLSRNRRIGVALIFLTGLLACASGITNLTLRRTGRFTDPKDFSWTIIPIYATSIVEMNVGLMCLALPVVSVPLLSRITKLGGSLASWLRERSSRRDNVDSGSSNHDSSPPVLPKVPGGNLTGVRPLFRNFNRTGHGECTQEVSGVNSFNDRESVDFSYHAQIKSVQRTRPSLPSQGQSS